MSAPQRLGEILVAGGELRPDQLDLALQEQRRRDEPLAQVLISLGFVAPVRGLQALAAQMNVPLADLAEQPPSPAALVLVPAAVAQRLRAVPWQLDRQRRVFEVAMANPSDVTACDRLAAFTPSGMRFVPCLASDSAIETALARCYAQGDALARLIAEAPADGAASTTAEAGRWRIALIDALLTDAVLTGASDLHFAPEAGFLRVRLRIDGQLRTAHCLHREHGPALWNRLKLLAGMDIAESRVPQDGHFLRRLAGRDIDFRASTLPTLHGEQLVLRVLDRAHGLVAFDQLGLLPMQRLALATALEKPFGMTLVCGPTGAGKTTTLYSLLQQIAGDAVNVMTLEDPVEYALPGIRQCAVKPGIGLGFPEGVRAILRQDPDVLLLGEIRDEATAAMALRAAMTGHRVLSTLHANSALGALPRLFDLGLQPALLAGNVSALVAQRLLRRFAPNEVGTAVCTGRFAVFEVLASDDEFDELIANGAVLAAMRCWARDRGLPSLADNARQRVQAGDTTLAEARRVLGPIDGCG